MMEYEEIRRRFSRLTSAELRAEISERSRRRYDTRKVGADGCMIDAWILRACNELLTERAKTMVDTPPRKTL